ncbi:MAG: TonB-dependent receptor, partial [Flavobacteriales bacterium]
LFLPLVLLPSVVAFAQQPMDTVRLVPVVISAHRLTDFDAGVKVQQIDSATLARYQAADLGQLLRNESPVFIKSYGLGSLATTSFRGGSANHTAILWNGFNLGSPMNGMLDLSLVPVSLANNVSIQYGGAGALWGSGAVGGAVLLNSELVFDQGLTVDAGASFGSFSDLREHGGLSFSTKKWIASVRGYNITAQNDFPFRDNTLNEEQERRQRNAELAQHGIISENYYRINNRQKINLRLWYADGDRHIPPTLLQDNSTDQQQDRSMRATSEWQRTGDKVTSFVRAAWFDEQLWWHGESSDSAAFSHSRTVIAEAEMRIRLKERQLVSIGLNNTFAEALSDGYPERPQQNRSALFASYGISTKDQRSTTTVSLRQELVEQDLVPLTWTLGSAFKLQRWLTAKANLARVYRIPTFNDLYWQPGGNADLLPESGYSGELGLAAKCDEKRIMSFSGEATWFQRTMDNWIIWLPAGSYWSPQNLMNVWSRGLELRGGVAWHVKSTTIKLDVMTNYVVSTNETAKSANDASVGKQLIYVPVYSGQGTLSVIWKDLTVMGSAHYTGYRYTSTDNRQFLKPYLLVDAAVSYRLASGTKYVLALTAQVFNLLDETYQVMLNRPMPLRNFQVGINLRFNQPAKSTTETP